MVGLIPLGMPIVNEKGEINEFFRLRWEDVQQSAQVVPSRQSTSLTGQSAAISGEALYTALVEGLYRVSLYLRRTVVDGVSSSLQATLSWIDHAQTLNKALAVMPTDSVTEVQDSTSVLWSDAASDIELSIAYTSNTPGAMKYEAFAAVEQLQS